MRLNQAMKQAIKQAMIVPLLSLLLLSSLQTWNFHSEAQAISANEVWAMYMKDPPRTGFIDTYIPAEVEVKWVRQGNLSLASVVSDGIYAYLTRPTGLSAVSIQENATIWESNNLGTLTPTPLILGNFLIAGNQEGMLYFIERYSGYISQQVFIAYGCQHLLFANDLIFAAGNNWLTAIAQNGTVLWSLYFENEITAPPVWYLNNLYIISENTLIALNGNKTLWQISLNAGITGAMGAEGKIVLTSEDGRMLAIDAIAGEMKWEIEIGGRPASAPAYYNGLLFLTTINGTLFAISANEGAQIWNYSTEMESLQPPILNRYNVIFASGNYLRCMKQNTGEPLWSLDFEVSLITGLSMVSSTIFVGDAQGNIYCISAPKPELSISVYPSSITLYERTQVKITFSVFAGIVPAVNASLNLSVSLGTLSNYSGTTDELGTFALLYTAPPVKTAENVTLEAKFSFPGYRNTTRNISILVLPTPSVEVSLSAENEKVSANSLVKIQVSVQRGGKNVEGALVYVFCNNESLAEGYTDASGSFEFTYRAPEVNEPCVVVIEAKVYGSPANPFIEKSARLNLSVEPRAGDKNRDLVIYVSIGTSLALLSIFGIWNLLEFRRRK